MIYRTTHPTSKRPLAPVTSEQIGRWRQLLLVFYIILLGLILPFICWGSWGTPGHPHGGPHLVFLHPPEHSANSQMDHAPSMVKIFDDEDNSPMGRSTPDTISAISLIVAPLFLATAYSMRARQTIAWLAEYIRGKSATLPVPTPPPRLV